MLKLKNKKMIKIKRNKRKEINLGTYIFVWEYIEIEKWK
jgi:hypothetical protein